jgi:2-aminoadipate transaminase
MVAFEVLRDGFIDGQVEEIRSYYKGQRDAMLSAIDGSFPKAVNWTKPRGGMFIWVTLPEGRDSLELLEEAIGHGVAFVPGAPFYTDDGGRNAFRLSYTVAKPEEIESGIQTLGDILAGVAV